MARGRGRCDLRARARALCACTARSRPRSSRELSPKGARTRAQVLRGAASSELIAMVHLDCLMRPWMANMTCLARTLQKVMPNHFLYGWPLLNRIAPSSQLFDFDNSRPEFGKVIPKAAPASAAPSHIVQVLPFRFASLSFPSSAHRFWFSFRARAITLVPAERRAPQRRIWLDGCHRAALHKLRDDFPSKNLAASSWQALKRFAPWPRLAFHP